MSDPKKPIDLVGLRRLAAETWEVSVRMSLRHLTEAEKPDAELMRDTDIVPSVMAQGRRESHVRLAEAYALLARAVQKVPGSQF